MSLSYSYPIHAISPSLMLHSISQSDMYPPCLEMITNFEDSLKKNLPYGPIIIELGKII